MIAFSIMILLVLTGICVYACINHLIIALHRPIDRAHLLFSGVCLSLVCFGLSQVITYQVQTIPLYITVLKLNLSFLVLFYFLFPWFLAEYAGIRVPLPWIIALGAIATIILLVNAFQPFSLQFEEVFSLNTLKLPWGEEITMPSGRSGIGFWIGAILAFLILTFAMYALAMHWQRFHTRETLVMFFAVALFFITAMQGVLVRTGTIIFIHIGPIGFLIMVITISIALNFDTRRRLLGSEWRFRSLVEQSPYSIQVLSPAGDVRQVNAAWEKLWEIKAESLSNYNVLQNGRLQNQNVMSYVAQGLKGDIVEIPPVPLNTKENHTNQTRWIAGYIYPLKDTRGIIRDVILIHQDVTDKKNYEDAIRLIAAGVTAVSGEAFFQQLVLNLASVFTANYAYIGTLNNDKKRVQTIAFCDHGKIVPDISFDISGTPCDQVFQRHICIYPHNVQQQFPNDLLLSQMNAVGYIGTPLFDAESNPFGVLVVTDSKPLKKAEQLKDILEIFAARASSELQRQRFEEKIEGMAYEDYLTGLASRAHLHDRLSKALSHAKQTATKGALLLIDLDHFKTINDALGHDIGDELLRAVAQNIAKASQEKNTFVARLSGDDFVVLMEFNKSNTDEVKFTAQEQARRIMQMLEKPIYLGERAFNVSASIGIALFPINAETELDVIRYADMAMYQAKKMGRSNVQLYIPSLQAEATKRLELEDGLRHAIAKGELELYFQPQCNFPRNITGAEALLRWHHPDLGSIPPATFIRIAEESGLIHNIGGWVLRQTCKQLSAWLQKGKFSLGHLSFNVSPWQFTHPDFVEQVRQALDQDKAAARYLMLELTESALLYDLKEAIEKLKTLREFGLKIALDDFGTGYSSLAYLRDLPLDQIKIDKSFIGELSAKVEHPLVESIIDIGDHLKLEVVAEGVETEQQSTILHELGCEYFQGFFFSHPLTESEFLRRIP